MLLLSSTNLDFRRVVCLVALVCCTASLPDALHACNVSSYDQLLLIQRAETGPHSEPFSARLKGKTVRCASVGPIQVIQASGSSFFYVLDPKRVFHRWGTTASVTDQPLVSLIGFFAAYRHSDTWSLWRNYGRPPFDPDELISLDAFERKSELNWQSLTLIDEPAYSAAILEALRPDYEEFLKLLILDQVRISLTNNSNLPTKDLKFQYAELRRYTSELAVRVSVQQGGRIQEINFLLPINSMKCPFVGHAERR